MITRCDNCSVSLQLDDSKIPNTNFTIRCPRCQNLVRVQASARSTVQQLQNNAPAPAFGQNQQQFAEKEQGFELNQAMKTLFSALQKEKVSLDSSDSTDEKPRRVLLCLGDNKKNSVGKLLTDAGYKVYLAETPAQANERLREGKTEILLFSPDFASEFGGSAIVQQKVNAMPSIERRRLFLVSLEETGTTLNAHEAFLRNLNLIVNINDLPQLPLILNRSLRDFNELYRYYNKAVDAVPI
ncbi:MAG: zinc-ribbon domain-containing protein [Pyrinomonadaceae bacterium]|jgi:predicted Zn finger-like uncharacterized protein|nr:zinc-ribbon domain-containing protein [Pyrinomonadaceae bacterium]